jgi:hypothetical protein
MNVFGKELSHKGKQRSASNYISPFQGFGLLLISKRRAAPCVYDSTLSGL